jgi:hypothetical protein
MRERPRVAALVDREDVAGLARAADAEREPWPAPQPERRPRPSYSQIAPRKGPVF